jgi:hypothetical protein
VIEQATPEAWEQARLDYTSLCQFLQTFSAPQAEEDPDGVFLGLYTVGGVLLVPVVLAIRQRGYGHWIDDGFVWVSKRLADPETRARLSDPACLRSYSIARMKMPALAGFSSPGCLLSPGPKKPSESHPGVSLFFREKDGEA